MIYASSSTNKRFCINSPYVLAVFLHKATSFFRRLLNTPVKNPHQRHCDWYAIAVRSIVAAYAFKVLLSIFPSAWDLVNTRRSNWSLFTVQRRINLLNCIRGLRKAYAIVPIVWPNQHIAHKINMCTIQQFDFIPSTGPNQLTIWIFITSVSIQLRIRHANNDCIFFQICDWIPIWIDCKASLFIPVCLHLVKIPRAPFHLFLLILFILLGAIAQTYIGFACFLCLWPPWIWSCFRRRVDSLLQTAPLPFCRLRPSHPSLCRLPAKEACNGISAYCHL